MVGDVVVVAFSITSSISSGDKVAFVGIKLGVVVSLVALVALCVVAIVVRSSIVPTKALFCFSKGLSANGSFPVGGNFLEALLLSGLK